jgi:hypothetical protein
LTFEPLSHLKNAQCRVDEANRRYKWEHRIPLDDLTKGRSKPVVRGSTPRQVATAASSSRQELCFKGPRNLLSNPTDGSTPRQVATAASSSRQELCFKGPRNLLSNPTDGSTPRQVATAASSSRQESPAASTVSQALPATSVTSLTASTSSTSER